MKKVRITAIGKTCYPDLMEKYENPIQHTCEVSEGAGLGCQRLVQAGGLL